MSERGSGTSELDPLFSVVEIKPGHKYAFVYVGEEMLDVDAAEHIQTLWREFIEDPDPARTVVFEGRSFRLMELPPPDQTSTEVEGFEKE